MSSSIPVTQIGTTGIAAPSKPMRLVHPDAATRSASTYWEYDTIPKRRIAYNM